MIVITDNQILQHLSNDCNTNTKSCKDTSLNTTITNNYNAS